MNDEAQRAETIDPDATATGTVEDRRRAAAGRRAAGTRTKIMGRYELLDRLGSGGMGEVFAGYDPELDRIVAVKVLRSDLDDVERATLRLRREAQVMARLSHPNVIRVFDVGVEGDRVFVAMEFVEGGTLKDWIDRAPRTWQEILHMFTLAGRGLAAAHDAGLVHRDFKLSNVLVGDDGSVLVSDFGVAQPSRDSSDDALRLSPMDKHQTITMTGGVVGTPAYMAPEQHEGRIVDGRADQFSFCAALWRGLFGVMPFDGDEPEQLGRAKAGGRIVPPPAGARDDLPAFLRAAIERGLRADPAARFATMHELLAVLDNEPARRRRRRVRTAATLGAVLAAGFTTAWFLADHRAEGDPCAVTADRFRGIWDDDARNAVKAAFTATGKPEAEAAFHEVSRQLDARRTEWDAMRRQSCEATRVRKEQSDVAMDLRAACLERRLVDLGGFVAVLRRADASTITKAPNASASIGDVTACADASTLGRRAPVPTEPERRKMIDDLAGKVAAVRARIESGGHREAVAEAQDLVVKARAAGYPPLLAEALFALALADEDLDKPSDAERLLEEALLAAEAGGDDVLRFNLDLRLIRVVGYLLERDQDGQRHSERAEALLRRLGTDPRREARLARTQSTLEWANGRYEESRRRAERSVKLQELIDPQGADMVKSLLMLGVVIEELKEDDAALAIFERTRVLAESTFGPSSAELARSLQAIAGSLRRLGRLDEAQAPIERAIAIFEATYGPDSSDVARATSTLGSLQVARGKPELAVTALRKSVGILERTIGPEHAHTADALAKLGSALSKAHQPGAEETLLRAHAIYVKKHGANHPVAGYILRILGEHYLRSEQPAKALHSFEESRKAIEASQGATSPLLTRTLEAIGDADIALRKPAAAIPAYERALTLVGNDSNDVHYRHTIGFSLAKALIAAHRDKARALELARSARAQFLSEGDKSTSDVTSVDAWLAER